MKPIDVDGIQYILKRFKNMFHSKNPCVILGDDPRMDVLFKNFCVTAKTEFKGADVADGFAVMDNTHYEKGDSLKWATITRDDVLMMLDSADSRGFKLFGKHCEKPGQYGVLFTRKGVVVINREGDKPGREGGFISWKAYQLCHHLLVDQLCGFDDDTYGLKAPGEFVFMWYENGIPRDQIFYNITRPVYCLLCTDCGPASEFNFEDFLDDETGAGDDSDS